jgi:hypothetical protein
MCSNVDKKSEYKEKEANGFGAQGYGWDRFYKCGDEAKFRDKK